MYDVVVVGGGFAGLCAATWLRRYRRSVLVVSDGPSRNSKSHVVHGFPGYDGKDPADLLSVMQQEAIGYGAEFLEAAAQSTKPKHGKFIVGTTKGDVSSSRLLIATGTADTKPDIENFVDYDGVSAWHCPACDGLEYTNKKIVVIGWGAQTAGYVSELLNYSRDITVLTHGHAKDVSEESRTALGKLNVPIYDDTIALLKGGEGHIEHIVLADGTKVAADGIFYNIKHTPMLDLLRQLSCEFEDDAIRVDRQQQTSIPGVYAAGDIAPLEELVVVACAMGAVAASNIHKSLNSDSL